MTTTQIRPMTPRQVQSTPESQRAESLQAVLDDATLSGYHEQARNALAELVELTALAA